MLGALAGSLTHMSLASHLLGRRLPAAVVPLQVLHQGSGAAPWLAKVLLCPQTYDTICHQLTQLVHLLLGLL